MIEQYHPLSEIEGLEGLVDHFKREYGDLLLERMEQMKLRIGTSLTPQKTVLRWQRDFQHKDFYVLRAWQGCITGYRFNGSMHHNRNAGVCQVPLDQDNYITLRIELNYPA